MSRFSLCMLLCIGSTVAGCEIDEPQYQYDEAILSLTFTGFFVYDAGSLCPISGGQIRCCPVGTAIIGIKYGPVRAEAEVLKCAQLASPSGPRFIDIGTQRNAMMACPAGSILTGYSTARNLRICETPNPAPTFEFVDGLPPTMDSFPMHVCPTNFAVSGHNQNPNNSLFTCAL